MTRIVFRDVAKAFDGVWYEGRIYRMIKMDNKKPIIKIINSTLEDRSIKVRSERETSTSRKQEVGVLQETVVSPLLYNMFTADVPSNEDTQIMLYAIDTCIMATPKNPNVIINKLQTTIDDLEK